MRQQDAVDQLDELFAIVLELGLVAFDRLAEIVRDALHDLIRQDGAARRRRIGDGARARGDADREGQRETENAQHGDS